MKWWGLLLALCAAPLPAHDLITAESTQAYFSRLDGLQKVVASVAPGPDRARASLQIGLMLDEIRELLNRDIDAHGRVQGLASSFLVSELKARGAPLAWSDLRGRYAANLKYYRDAAKLAGDEAVRAEAAFRILQGWFFDSFTLDPLEPAGQTPAQLTGQVKLGEEFLARYPGHPGREEAMFILAIHYIQAARAAGETEQGLFARKARAWAERLAKDYPESLRVETLRQLITPHP